jgi:hypothetical protein
VVRLCLVLSAAPRFRQETGAGWVDARVRVVSWRFRRLPGLRATAPPDVANPPAFGPVRYRSLRLGTRRGRFKDDSRAARDSRRQRSMLRNCRTPRRRSHPSAAAARQGYSPTPRYRSQPFRAGSTRGDAGSSTERKAAITTEARRPITTSWTCTGDVQRVSGLGGHDEK